VIVVSGSVKPAKLAHGAAVAGVAPMPTSEASKAVAITVALWMHLIQGLPVLEFARTAHSSGIPASRRPAK
jgi:hypothetical protein